MLFYRSTNRSTEKLCINTFQFSDISGLTKVLEMTPPSRLRHFGYARVFYSHRIDFESADGFNQLKETEHLQKLGTGSEENEWERLRNQELLGFNTLRHIKILTSVTFYRLSDETVRAHLTADLTKPKAMEKEVGAGAKRKAGANGIRGGEAGKKPKQKS